MAKRGYKLQEFVAHSANVNCLSIGKKACRLFITGGDDHKVNLWAIGKPTSLMSLCGHTSSVEAVAFDSAEVLVLGGASAGVIKLWDLEEAKMVRTLTGHRSNCTAVEFHPFGEFFASGSMDTNLKIWDIRKKGCIHTYKGHTQGVSTIRFTPDGRWVVSGGYDNVVKVWDLTAGKLLHDFKFHEGHIRSLDFHPLEFLLATGSADRTVKFWDLETFELIGSARPEATGVRTITFHPDGRTLFCGLDDSLKVYSWEPVVCHDSVDIGWSTLGDLCISEGKLLGCSYYRNSVGVWVADISLIEPYGAGFVPEQIECTEKKFDLRGSPSSEKVGTHMRSNPNLRCMSPDSETKVKNIYVDSTGGKPVASQRIGSLNSPKVVLPVKSEETSNLPTEKQGPEKFNGQVLDKSFVVPNIVPRDIPVGKDSLNSGKESITFSRTKPGMLLRPAHVRRPSNSKIDAERLSMAVESGTTKSELDNAMDHNIQIQLVSENGARKSSEEKDSNIKSVTEKFDKSLSPQTPPSQQNCDESLNCSKGTNSIKFVNGVAVVPGRTRTLVERFERRERFDSNEDQATSMTPHVIPESDKTPTPLVIPHSDKTPTPHVIPKSDTSDTPTSHVIPESNRTPTPRVIPEPNRTPNPRVIPEPNRTPTTRVIPEPNRTPTTRVIPESNRTPTPRVISESNRTPTPRVIPESDRTPIPRVIRESDRTPSPCVIPESDKAPSSRVIPESDKTPTVVREEPQISGRDSTSASGGNVIENLMQTHDVFLSTLRSRLTKLQVVRHFWERKDTKGAINAMRKLPDHSVQADVISVLMEKTEILTLDLFFCLLPVLMGLLDSKTERHASISLEMLLKLVAVFGPVVRSTISAPPVVGVDLQAEQRRERCNQCFIQMQKIQKILPALIRRGGLLAKCARELNLVLQES